MDIKEIEGKVLALMLTAKAADGEEEITVISGTVRLEEGRAYVDRGPGRERFWIRDEWEQRIKLVAPDLRRMLPRAHYYLPLSVGNLTDEEPDY